MMVVNFGFLTGLLLIARLAHGVNARCDDDDNNTNVDDSDYYKPRCGLTEIPKTIPPSTQNLDLSYNVIATIPIGVFSSLTQCEDLSLSNNRLTVLTQGMFTGLEMLESLYLSSNEISHIEPETFSNLTTLMHLLLDHNKLIRLQRHLFSGLESLEELQLDHNEIISIATGTFAPMPFLRILGLSGNRLTLLTSGVFHQNNSVHAAIHPVELELSLSDNPVFCNRKFSWLKEAEVEGWVSWFAENGGDHDGKPECYNYSDNNTTWDDLTLEAMKADYSSLSYHKPIWQSSFIEGATPGKTNGNQSSDFRSASCARTAMEAFPWSVVDLQSEYEITHVVITNNEDEKFRDLTVAIGNSFASCESLNANNYVPCSERGRLLGNSDTWWMTCDEPVRGRYLTVYLNATGSLTLCGVEVYGLPVPAEWNETTNREEDQVVPWCLSQDLSKAVNTTETSDVTISSTERTHSATTNSSTIAPGATISHDIMNSSTMAPSATISHDITDSSTMAPSATISHDITNSSTIAPSATISHDIMNSSTIAPSPTISPNSSATSPSAATIAANITNSSTIAPSPTISHDITKGSIIAQSTTILPSITNSSQVNLSAAILNAVTHSTQFKDHTHDAEMSRFHTTETTQVQSTAVFELVSSKNSQQIINYDSSHSTDGHITQPTTSFEINQSLNNSDTPDGIYYTNVSPTTLLLDTSNSNQGQEIASTSSHSGYGFSNIDITSDHITVPGTDGFETLQTEINFESTKAEDKPIQPTEALDVVTVASEEHSTSTMSSGISPSNVTTDHFQNQNKIHIKINCSSNPCKKNENVQSVLKNVSLEITGLDLSGSYIETLTGDSLSMLQQLTFLSLENCSIRQVQHNAFAHLTELKTLKLNENNITTLPEGVFYNQRKLEILDLGGNPFRHIRVQTLIGLESLTELRLTKCKLESLDPISFRSLSHLQVVQVDLKHLEDFKGIYLNPGSFPNTRNTPVVVVEGTSSLPCDNSTCWLEENLNRNEGVKVQFLFEGEFIRPNCSRFAGQKWDEVDLHCSETESIPLALIIGGTAGSVVLVIVICAAIWCKRKGFTWRKRKEPSDLHGADNTCFSRECGRPPASEGGRPPAPEAHDMEREPGCRAGNLNPQRDHNTNTNVNANTKPRRFLKQPKTSNLYSRENPAFEGDYLEVLPPLEDTLQGAAAAEEGYEVPVKSGPFDHLYNRCGDRTLVTMATGVAVVNEGYEVPVPRDRGLYGNNAFNDDDSEEIYEEINEEEMLDMKGR